MDMEKVIKAMEHCIGDDCNGDKWSECEYSAHGCIDALLVDAIELLKAKGQNLVKVIKAMERCFGENCNSDKWGECEYSGHGCIDALFEDAIALLKEQVPRLLTLEEACNADYVWFEWRTMGVIPAKVTRVPHKTGTYRVQRSGDIDAWEHADEYGEYWRCWTSRPTDEKREATPWQS